MHFKGLLLIARALCASAKNASSAYGAKGGIKSKGPVLSDKIIKIYFKIFTTDKLQLNIFIWTASSWQEHSTLNPESSKKNLIIWTASSVGRAFDS